MKIPDTHDLRYKEETKDDVPFSELVGKSVVRIVVELDEEDNERMSFVLSDGSAIVLFHFQSCCERVGIEDVCGDLEDLLIDRITRAEERSNDRHNEDESAERWTFYEIATRKGSVTVRWHGKSNGYYSVAVSVLHAAEIAAPEEVVRDIAAGGVVDWPN
jgi:hypothetical protein